MHSTHCKRRFRVWFIHVRRKAVQNKNWKKERNEWQRERNYYKVVTMQWSLHELITDKTMSKRRQYSDVSCRRQRDDCCPHFLIGLLLCRCLWTVVDIVRKWPKTLEIYRHRHWSECMIFCVLQKHVYLRLRPECNGHLLTYKHFYECEQREIGAHDANKIARRTLFVFCIGKSQNRASHKFRCRIIVYRKLCHRRWQQINRILCVFAKRPSQRKWQQKKKMKKEAKKIIWNASFWQKPTIYSNRIPKPL